jgi:RNA polymerase sporulation-specific sigma factor
LSGGEQDDLYQEGMIGLFEAYKSFDSSKGSHDSESFKLFAIMCIKRQILDAIKHANTKKHMPLNNYVSFTRTDNLGDDATLDEAIAYLESTDAPLEQVIDKESYDEKLQLAISTLSAYEQEVIRLYLDGLTNAEIATALQKDSKSIYNCIERIKHKIRGEK